jgi:hypothetical protein
VNRTLLLAKTFFGRFFETDLMPPGLPQVQLVIWAMAFLAAPGLLLPVQFVAKYTILRAQSSEALTRAMLVDSLLFITLTMTAIGFVALVIWDGMFPDRRDARILMSLPLPGRVPIAARLLALSALVGIFLAGVNVVPSLIFGAAVGRFGGATNSLRGILAHLIGTSLAGIFVFTSLMALQGCILNVGGRRTADRIALLLQVLFVMALLQMIFFLPRMGAMLPGDLRDPRLFAIPSMWFLGLYDVLGGRPAPGAAGLASIAALATLTSISLAVGLFVATHGRLTRLAIESPEVSRPRGRAILWIVDAITARVVPHPIARAIFEFTLRTLSRSRSHRLLLATYLGVALALIASAIVPLVIRSGVAAFATPSVSILSAPFVLGFLVLIGARLGLAIPVEPKANWVFRIREPVDRVHAIGGVRAALLVVGVVPMVVVAGISAGILWGGWPALVHVTVCALMGWLLVELVLMRFDKLPFTCTYLPGKSGIFMLWPLYLNGFIAYCYTTAAAELALFNRPTALIKVLLVVLAAIVFLTVRRRRALRELLAFRFQEEDAAAMFAGFHLSEGFASNSEDTRRLR